MPDFLLELRSEEIPARMQAKAEADLAGLFAERLAAAGLRAGAIETFSTPRRLSLIARDLPAETEAIQEEVKGPRVGAPPQALEGFLRKTGLSQDQLVERDGALFAVIERPGRATSALLAEAIPAIVRGFPWPKSMRWGEASVSTESLRWVRPLLGIVALLGEEIVEFEIAGVKSGAATMGHRFHHPGIITIGSAGDYAEKLRACHVIVDPAERRRIIAEGARAAAEAAGLTLVEDEGLVAENAGLTEWPVPLLGSFDPAFLDVPREVIQLTMRTNQKYFTCVDSSGALAPNFVCTANIEASDGGSAIVDGNRKVLAARLSDAKFFWEQDLKVPLEEQAAKLSQIVFHEKLGTVADKVDRVARLARWLVEEGIVGPSGGSSPSSATNVRHAGLDPAPMNASRPETAHSVSMDPDFRQDDEKRARLADLAERAARLAKADLVTQMVGEFPELQGVIGGYLARAQGEPDEVADAIRDHYKPVGQGDDVPIAPVTVAVSLADKLDTLGALFSCNEIPSGSKDPFALRRAAIALLNLISINRLRMPVVQTIIEALGSIPRRDVMIEELDPDDQELVRSLGAEVSSNPQAVAGLKIAQDVTRFISGRLLASLKAEGKRADFIRAAFYAGVSDFLSMMDRATALQTFIETSDGADLLAGYKRSANILRKEGWEQAVVPTQAGASGPQDAAANPVGTPASARITGKLSYDPLPEEAALIAALDSAEPRARAAVEAENFEGAMAALASLRAPVDAFFDKVTVNDSDSTKREARLNLLARMRDAVHQVADFSKIEG